MLKPIQFKQSYKELNEKYLAVRNNQEANDRIRIYRALSWLNQAENTQSLDSQFIFLWISFNAIYARAELANQNERDNLMIFLKKLIQFDDERQLYKMMSSLFSGPIRLLLNNKFAFQPFWNAFQQHDSSGRWKEQFDHLNKQAFHLHFTTELAEAIKIVFDRLYTIRNQLIHGGSTCNGSLNREQLHNATQILAYILPIMIEIMIKHSDEDFGEIAYPVFGDALY